MLCVGDFFGPVREGGSDDNPEVARLLNGDIVGTLVRLSPLCRLLTGYSLRSSVQVLPDARPAGDLVMSTKLRHSLAAGATHLLGKRTFCLG